MSFPECVPGDAAMDAPAKAVFADLSVGPETWLTVEICVLANSVHAGQLREVCDEMLRRGLPVYVSLSKRGTPYKAGT